MEKENTKRIKKRYREVERERDRQTEIKKS